MFGHLTRALFGVAATAPSLEPRCNAINETYPWILSSVTAFNATVAGCESWICFHFCDYNPDAALDTECTLYVDGPLSTENTLYSFCDNEDVQFVLTDGGIDVGKSVTDPCTGDAPSYEVDFFGSGVTNWTATPATDGLSLTAPDIYVPITSSSVPT